MTEQLNSILEELKSVVAAHPEAAPQLLNSYIDVKGRLRTLLARKNSKPIDLRENERSVVFRDPTYVRRIEISYDAAEMQAHVQVVAIDIDGNESFIEPLKSAPRADAADSKFTYFIKTFLRSIEIRDADAGRPARIRMLSIYGLTSDAIETVGALLNDHIDIRVRLDQFLLEIASQVDKSTAEKSQADEASKKLREANTGLNSAKKRLTQELERLDEVASEAKREIDSLNNTTAQISENINQLKINEAALQEQSKALAVKNSAAKRALEELVNDRNLISDEYRDFVKEGRGQSWIYVGLTSALIAVMGVCAVQIYLGARRILTGDEATSDAVFALILQRIPFTLALVLIVGLAWRAARPLIARIFAIHVERLSLAKLLVVAKDITFSAVDSLDISDEEKYRERVRLKVEMLKAHLGKDLMTDSLSNRPATVRNEQIAEYDPES